eukprot:TRINITY_DN2676_c0_g2_i1.p1 TRINITY_DN2676_c0_g2~~TRINITY_DN2676_c0_g2_i1.p1  ORF type:complete len:442 (+),score=71.42 TRINITY_DN2676_c0_g2_i1:3-1328(+)
MGKAWQEWLDRCQLNPRDDLSCDGEAEMKGTENGLAGARAVGNDVLPSGQSSAVAAGPFESAPAEMGAKEVSAVTVPLEDRITADCANRLLLLHSENSQLSQESEEMQGAESGRQDSVSEREGSPDKFASMFLSSDDDSWRRRTRDGSKAGAGQDRRAESSKSMGDQDGLFGKSNGPADSLGGSLTKEKALMVDKEGSQDKGADSGDRGSGGSATPTGEGEEVDSKERGTDRKDAGVEPSAPPTVARGRDNRTARGGGRGPSFLDPAMRLKILGANHPAKPERCRRSSGDYPIDFPFHPSGLLHGKTPLPTSFGQATGSLPSGSPRTASQSSFSSTAGPIAASSSFNDDCQVTGTPGRTTSRHHVFSKSRNNHSSAVPFIPRLGHRRSLSPVHRRGKKQSMAESPLTSTLPLSRSNVASRTKSLSPPKNRVHMCGDTASRR